MKFNLLYSICILSVWILACGNQPRKELGSSNRNVRFVEHKKDSTLFLVPFLLGDYKGVLANKELATYSEDSAFLSASFSSLGQFRSARRYITDFDNFEFDPKDDRQCFDYDKLERVTTASTLLALYYYYRNYYREIDPECMKGVFVVNRRFGALKSEILVANELWELAVSGLPGRLISQHSLDEIHHLELKFPYWNRTYLLEAFHYQYQKQYELAAKHFKDALRFGKDEELILSNIVRCYSEYSGTKDTSIIEGGKVYFSEIEVVGFLGQNIPDSMRKYEKLRDKK
jgi:tetratricopeptide (TPR) repeat protein